MYTVEGLYDKSLGTIIPEWDEYPITHDYRVFITFVEPAPDAQDFSPALDKEINLRLDALKRLESFRKPLTISLDYKTEYMEYLDEKYNSIN